VKILIVGGNGLIGGHAALRLAAKGHDVTIGSRKRPATGTPLGDLSYLPVDYTAEAKTDLGKFEVLVFAAGNDVRHVPKGVAMDEHVVQANTVAIPRFFAAAKRAGVRRAINIGSFYPQAAPQLLANNAYMRSRRDSDVGLRKLADDSFFAISLNAPFVQGFVPGLPTRAENFMRFAEGKLDLPPEVPPGGVN
jgi:dihydroflavonol-4-reductase